MLADQRQFFRCPLSDERPPAVLVVDGKTVRCRLVEMSLGGFGVIAAKAVNVVKEPLARLKVRGLEYVVRVTHQEPYDKGVFLGLMQVEELVPDNATTGSASPWTTAAVWVAALGIVAAAAYCLTALHDSIPQLP